MWGKLMRGLGCLTYLGTLGAIFALVAYFAFSVFVRGGVTAVPALGGLEEVQASALLADQGLRAVWSDDTRFDESVPRDHVLLQDPRAGVYVKRNTEVRLTLSRGPKRIEVPSLVGQAVQAAQVSLAAASLTSGQTYQVWSADGAEGEVVAQQPAAGSRVEVDAPIDLYVASANTARVFVMPDVVQRNYEDVRRFFAGHGIRIGRVSYETYDGVAPGTVLRQFPLAGHPLRSQDVISLGVVAPPPEQLNKTLRPATDRINAPETETGSLTEDPS